MAAEIAAPEPDLPNIRKHVGAPRPIGRLLGWAGAACLALAAVVLTSQTEAGSQRLRIALDSMGDPIRVFAQIPPRPNEMKVASNAETERLALQVRELTADREKLNARIATLEHNLEDMTGSIKQQPAQLAASRAAMTAPPPAVSAPTTTASVSPAKPLLPALAPITPKVVTETAPAAPEPPTAEKTAEVPMPPVRIAAVPASEPAAEKPPAKVEFGVDLGAASSLEALRMHWAAVKANYGPLLAGLHPLVTEHSRQPSGVIYRLVAGPLPNAADATKLCARLPVTRTGCRPAKFDGAELAAH
jgi:outer membrane murein-binding lipoprotein Lpp